MIKHHSFLIFALIFSGSSLSQDQVVSADDVFEQWENSLNTHLLNHPHPYVQAIALSLSRPDLPLINDADKRIKLNHEQQNYVDHINQLAKQDNLSAETIFLLISLCSNDAIEDVCDRQRLVKQYQQQHPNDLFAYFEPFARAVRNKDMSRAEYLIKDMRNTTYATDMISLPTVFKSALNDYMDQHPLPRAVIKKQLKHLTEIDESLSDKQLNQAFYYIKMSGIKMALPLPAFKPLLDYCSLENSPTEACVKVADILMTQGNDIISQLIAYRLRINSYESSLETDLVVQAEEKNDQFRAQYECIMDALKQNNRDIDYMDTDYAKIWFSDDNELNRIKSAAHYLYKKAQHEGISDFKDPTTCDIVSLEGE